MVGIVDRSELLVFCASCGLHTLASKSWTSFEGEVGVFTVNEILWFLPMASNFLRGDEGKFLEVEVRDLSPDQYFLTLNTVLDLCK
jgi:hypothetical protein